MGDSFWGYQGLFSPGIICTREIYVSTDSAFTSVSSPMLTCSIEYRNIYRKVLALEYHRRCCVFFSCICSLNTLFSFMFLSNNFEALIDWNNWG